MGAGGRAGPGGTARRRAGGRAIRHERREDGAGPPGRAPDPGARPRRDLAGVPPGQPASMEPFLTVARDRLRERIPGAQVGGGTNAYFTHLNRERPSSSALDVAATPSTRRSTPSTTPRWSRRWRPRALRWRAPASFTRHADPGHAGDVPAPVQSGCHGPGAGDGTRRASSVGGRAPALPLRRRLDAGQPEVPWRRAAPRGHLLTRRSDGAA